MKVLYLIRKLSNKERKVEPYKDDAGRVVASQRLPQEIKLI